jgi:metallo-beta-lactamase class B
MKARAWRLGAIVLMAAGLMAQMQITPLPVTNNEWEVPFPPVHIVGNVYYVGTHELAAYLITTDEGHILINTGVASSVPMIQENIAALGFDFDDIEVITATHAHHDHVAGLGEIQRLTGAEMYMQEADVPVIVSGGNDDYRYPDGRGYIYEPIEVQHILQDGDTIELGGVVLTAHHHPGHTKGATSFSLTVEENGRDYNVLIANMGSVNAGVNLTYMPGYPEIAEDYRRTFEAQQALNPDIWLASHAAQFGLHEKYAPGMAYDPNRFVDPEGWHAKVAEYEAAYEERLVTDADRPRE